MPRGRKEGQVRNIHFPCCARAFSTRWDLASSKGKNSLADGPRAHALFHGVRRSKIYLHAEQVSQVILKYASTGEPL